MNITPYSRKIILETFRTWHVDKEFADPMYNYLVHGFNPGSCFTAVLANDFLSAVSRSHPANTIEAFKKLAGWIRDTVPAQARGSYEAVDHWTSIGPEFRREVLEGARLVLTEDQEMWATLKNGPAVEPVLY
jgi:hypothetical protein